MGQPLHPAPRHLGLLACDPVRLSGHDSRRGAGLRGGLFLRWTAGSALGGAAFAFAARRVSLAAGGAAGDSLGLFAAEAVIGAVALGGMMAGIGAMQWLAGRKHLPWAPRLVLSRGAAGAAGGATALGMLAALTGGVASGGAVAAACAVGLAAYWITEWLVLRGQAAGARKVASMSAAGLVAAVLATALAGVAAGDLGAEWVAGAVFGAAYGAVTGFGLPATA